MSSELVNNQNCSIISNYTNYYVSCAMVAEREDNDAPRLGKDVGNGFPKEGIFALNVHEESIIRH